MLTCDYAGHERLPCAELSGENSPDSLASCRNSQGGEQPPRPSGRARSRGRRCSSRDRVTFSNLLRCVAFDGLLPTHSRGSKQESKPMDNTVKARYELREGIQPPRRIAYSGVRAGTVLRTGVQNVQNVNQYSHPCNAQSKPNAVFRQRTRPKIPSEQAARRWNQRPLTTFGSRIETAPSSSTRMSWRHGGRITMTVTERKLAGEASKSVGGRAVAAVLDQSAADRSSEVTLEAAPRHGGTVPHGDAVTVIGRTQPAVADLNHRDSVESHIELAISRSHISHPALAAT
jgi:hypothetical protein